jgi:DNA repair exonuclease SbcCD ATPase subunit
MKKLSILILLTLFAFSNGSLWAEEAKEPAVGEKVSLLADTAEAKAAEVYSCPIHPEVRQDKEGKCPVCGMDLEKTEHVAEKNEDATQDGHEHDSNGQGIN